MQDHRDAATVVVRVNAVGTPWHDDDVAGLLGLPAVVMLPKAEAAEHVDHVSERLDGAPVIPLIETPRGVLSAVEVAGAEGAVRLAFGHIDLVGLTGRRPHVPQRLCCRLARRSSWPAPLMSYQPRSTA